MLPPLDTLILEEESEDEEHSPSDISDPTHSGASIPILAPTPSAMYQVHHAETLHPRPRNRSPYSRGHLRSYTAATNLSAPPMARTRSLPTVASRSFSPSPSHSPVRQSSPHRSGPGVSSSRISPRRSFEEAYPATNTIPSFLEIESIAEDSELSIPPRAPPSDRDFQSLAEYQQQHHAFPRSSSNNNPNLLRRRPVSPLAPIYQLPPNTSPALTPPPLPLTPARYNESYPGSTTSSISMPSTPTSLRSRSPSISSLGTIPDSPDAEEAAVEEFNIAKLKAAADAADAAAAAEADAEGGRRRGGGGAGGSNRKRWSVCGAERRGDFEMETIWED